AAAREVDAGDGPPISGIVAFVDLTLGDLLEQAIVAHRDASDGRLRGVRHTTGWDPSDEIVQGHGNPYEGIMGSDEFRSGLQEVAAAGLTFESWLFHPQLPELAAMAADIPELTVVIGHLGAPLGVGPYREHQTEVVGEWQASMAACAAQPNVVVKLGGIGLDMLFGTGWSELDRPPGSEEVAEYWSDRVRFCVDTFGPHRCMFESNYPIDRETLPYPVIWNAFQIMAAEYSAAEQDDLFSGTAKRSFRL
ncbi:MAG: amidohydrolase family protein, partial [Acidimicrobiales bacterium]